MEDDPEQLDRYVEDLLQDRRPARVPLPDEDALRARQTAAMLRAAKPGSTLPAEDFRQQLERDIRTWLHERTEELPAGRRHTRRGVILGGLSGLAAGILAALGVERVLRRPAGGPAPTPGPTPVPSEPPLVAPDRGQWLRVMAFTEVPEGKPLRFTAGAIEGYLIRDGANLRAMSAVCTHMACLLNWSAFRSQFECPCHGATFQKSGEPSRHYAGWLKALPALEVRVEDGQVQVFGA